MLASILCVAAGAIIGAIARFLITHFSSELSHHHGFPYGTLIVNVVGCAVVGYVLTWTADHEHDRWRLLMADSVERLQRSPHSPMKAWPTGTRRDSVHLC